ncbi:phosphatase protein [Spatholobus suberectus]|nr:phosphatase protein [Spatholobus suberectus]
MLFEGKVTSFPFDDHNCPPIQLIISFCQSAYAWLKDDIENVVVVHWWNVRSLILVSDRLPYLVLTLTHFECVGMLFSTKKHPRTKNLLPEDIWFSTPKKGVMVFALPGKPDLIELAGDFKIHFHDRQGDFYW